MLAPKPAANIPVKLVEWSACTTYMHGIPYVLVSILEEDVKETDEGDTDTIELKQQLAQARWLRFRSYWKLAKIFREMRREVCRDPLEIELFAYLQLPTTYNWRYPTSQERYQMLRWAQGLDDMRPRAGLYQHSKWIADQLFECAYAYAPTDTSAVPLNSL